jgi:hypothetical protein
LSPRGAIALDFMFHESEGIEDEAYSGVDIKLLCDPVARLAVTPTKFPLFVDLVG